METDLEGGEVVWTCRSAWVVGFAVVAAEEGVSEQKVSLVASWEGCYLD